MVSLSKTMLRLRRNGFTNGVGRALLSLSQAQQQACCSTARTASSSAMATAAGALSLPTWNQHQGYGPGFGNGNGNGNGCLTLLSTSYSTKVGDSANASTRSKLDKRIASLTRRYRELVEKVNDTNASIPQSELSQMHREIGKLSGTVENVEQLHRLRDDHRSMAEMAEDAEEDEEMRDLAREESAVIETKLEEVEFQIMKDILPKPVDNVKGLLLEIRAGTGGEEAALFVVDLFQMYQKFAGRNRWKFEVLSLDEAEYGGYKEVIVEVTGDKAYHQLQFESGIHRVQRVPKTEAGGRIHTSASSVAVMPQATEVELHVSESDLKVETYRSGGAGGQHVNTTDSAVRVTHLPTQISVSIQDDRSQHKNRAKAMKILLARLYEEELRKRNAALAEKRKSQIGSGDRSERIRTYNFQQGRVTDHRVNLTLHNLEQVLAGNDLEVVIGALEKQAVIDYLESEEDEED